MTARSLITSSPVPCLQKDIILGSIKSQEKWFLSRVGLGITQGWGLGLHSDLGCILWRSCRVKGCVVYVCLGLGRYLSVLRVKVIILTKEVVVASGEEG